MMKYEHKDKNSTSGYPHDKVYDVVVDDARMKNPVNGEWIDAVIYSDGVKMFVREKSDFMEKFKAAE